MEEPPGDPNLALTMAHDGAQAHGSNESRTAQAAAFRRGPTASTTTTSLLAGSARPAHHTGNASWTSSSDAMSGGRGAQAQDQHPSQGLSQGAAAGGAAQGALASSVQAASTLAGAIDQPPAFGTRFATQRRHITCPPSLTNAIATAAQVLTGGAARARSPPQGAAASAAARMSVTEAAEAAAAAIPPAAGGGRQVEQSLAVPSLASSPLAPAVDGGGSQPYESGAHAAGGLGTTTEGEGTLHMQGHAAPRREEGTSATLQRESTLLQSLHRELQQELHSLPVGRTSCREVRYRSSASSTA